jgi:hypothetical protein
MTDTPTPESITPEEFADILALGHETARVEIQAGRVYGRVN